MQWSIIAYAYGDWIHVGTEKSLPAAKDSLSIYLGKNIRFKKLGSHEYEADNRHLIIPKKYTTHYGYNLKENLMKERDRMQELIGEVDKIQVGGMGKMSPESIKKDVIRKLQDLLSRAKGDEWSTIGASNLEIMAHLWLTMSAHSEEKKLPSSTLIRSK